MAVRKVTAPEALDPLLGWINGDELSPDEAGSRLLKFLRLTMTTLGDFAVPEGESMTPTQVEGLREEIRQMLDDSRRELDTEDTLELPSLRFDIRRARDRPPKLSGGRAKRREVENAEAFLLIVKGGLRDLILYLLMRALTQPGAIHLSRCPAPAPGDWTRACGRYFISGGHVGRPAQYCSPACRVRMDRKRRH